MGREVKCFDYGMHVIAEEHLFIAKNTVNNKDEGWLIGTVHNLEEEKTGIMVLDAQDIESEPIASAWLPYMMPLGLHGIFH